MRRHRLACILALATSCGGGDGKPQDAGIDVALLDAPEMMPTLTSFSPSLMQVPANAPTMVTWNWTYLVNPVIPEPTCTIDNNVGTVTPGQQTSITLTKTTTFRLTCSNRAGMTARDTVIAIPNAPPTLNSFTATPFLLTPNSPTSVTFNWTFSTFPSPTPTCTIDAGIGAATAGAQSLTSQLTLSQSRTFRLRCQSTQGTSTLDATVDVDECTAGTHDCGPNSTCTNAPNGYTCGCSVGYAMSTYGQCSATATNCGATPAVCSTDAECQNTTTCACKPGFVGDGLTCTRSRVMFVTSTSFTGNLGGLAGADAACNTAAGNAGLQGTYVAWLSDATHDAYCRVHGLTGKKSAMCGQGTLPATAGPWVRNDASMRPAAPTIDKLLAPTRQTFYPVNYDQTKAEVLSAPLTIWTGTDDTGAYTGNACTDWTVTSGQGTVGDVTGAGVAWTDQGTDPTCSSSARLRCVEVAAGSGPTLPRRFPTGAKRAFVTSVSGTGLLSSRPDVANLGFSGLSAADAICQARARFGGYASPGTFKAVAGSSSFGASRIVNASVAWYRPDNVQIATSETNLFSGRLLAPLYQTETGAYANANAETGSVWTGTTSAGGFSSSHCSSWLTASSSSFATIGRFELADARWIAATTSACNATDYRLYCVDDSAP